MAEDREKALEMRIAALEDKLAKLHVTEEEMRAYEKVSALLGGAGAEAAAGAGAPQYGISRARAVCIYRQRQIVRFCYECQPCWPCGPEGGGFSGGGGFGGFGG